MSATDARLIRPGDALPEHDELGRPNPWVTVTSVERYVDTEREHFDKRVRIRLANGEERDEWELTRLVVKRYMARHECHGCGQIKYVEGTGSRTCCGRTMEASAL